MSYISVIGAGSWGTTLAALLADKGYDTSLWAFEQEVAEEIQRTGINSAYLPEIKLPEALRVSADLKSVLSGARYVVNAVPTQFTRAVITEALPHIDKEAIIVSVSKGLEKGTYLTVSTILKDLTGRPAAVLSGPSFAKEVVRKMPTAVTLASEDYSTSLLLQEIFNTSFFRVYTHFDVLGVELGGALKNVMAVASGISDGLGLGNNARAALITRGISEITRLAVMMGANERTFSGLSGIGDLVLTCSSPLSRNYTVGYNLGQGMTLKDIVASTKSVAEGVETTLSTFELSKKLDVDMPIVEQVYRVLYEDRPPAEAVAHLMSRALKSEFHG